MEKIVGVIGLPSNTANGGIGGNKHQTNTKTAELTS